jgi:hypothetical protein
MATQLESAIDYASARAGFATICRRQFQLDFDRANRAVPPVAAQSLMTGLNDLAAMDQYRDPRFWSEDRADAGLGD